MRKRERQHVRTIRTLYLVICEGETERAYVEMLKRRYRVPITIKTKVSGASINPRLLARYIQELGIGASDSCEVFFIYDADVQNVVDRLRSLEGHTIFTNPCIELWFLLHARSHTRAIASAQVVAELIGSHPVWAGYEKGKLTSKQTDYLIGGMALAIERAKRLTPGGNPSSDIPEFIAAIEKGEKT